VTGPSSPHILLVDDDTDTREVLRLILESDGLRVMSAIDGLDALHVLEAIHRSDPLTPCAIVLDYMMPRFSGAEFRARQLANPDIADVPIILLSAISDIESRAASLRPFAVLQKPVHPDRLVDAVRQAAQHYLSRHRRID
jgi:two-component system, chemotaxis family, chemotaxis protein CheY